jgi:hypothetical protein
MEKLKKAKEVYKALIVLADFLGMSENQIATNVSLFDNEKFEKIKEAVNLVNEFNEKPIKERMEAMGFNYKDNSDGSYEVSTEL